MGNQFPVLQTLCRLFGLPHLNLASTFFINQSWTITTAQMGDKTTGIKEIVSALNKKKKKQAIKKNAQINLFTLMENKWWQTILLSLSSSPCFCSSVLLSLWEAKCAHTEVGQPENQCKYADQDRAFNAPTTSSRRLILMGPAVLMQIFFTWLWLKSRAYRVRQQALPVWNQTSQQRGLIEISPRNRERLCSSQAKKQFKGSL